MTIYNNNLLLTNWTKLILSISNGNLFFEEMRKYQIISQNK